eukprot:EG_transcript_6421
MELVPQKVGQIRHHTIFRRCKVCHEDLDVREFRFDFTICDVCLAKKDFVPRYKRLCDEKVEPDEWPTDASRYTDECPENCRLEKRQQFREFVLGTGCFHTPGFFDDDELECDYPRLAHVHCGQNLSALLGGDRVRGGPADKSMTFHTKVMLVKEQMTELRIYVGELPGRGREGKETIRGVTFCKGDSYFDTGCVNRERQYEVKFDPDFPFIKSITIQHRVWQVDAEQHRLEKRISYLHIQPCKGEPLEYGELLQSGMHGGEWVTPPETAKGTLAIVGIGFAHAQPLSFQLVDCTADPKEEISLFLGRDMMSCVSVSEHLQLYEHCRVPVVEDPEVYDLLDNLMDAIENASPSDGELLPNAIKFIDKTHSGEIATMFSIFCMDRYLMHVLQTNCEVGWFDKDRNHWRRLLSLKHMLAIVSEVTMTSRRLQHFKPQPNIYTYGILTGDKWDATKAVLTFCTQLMLILMLVDGGIDVSAFGDVPAFLFIAVIVTAIVSFIVWGQVENHYAVRQTLVKDLNHSLMRLDYIANVVITILVVLLDFALLGSADEYFDLVMNSTAIIFILEIDDSVMSADEEQIKDLFRSSAYKAVQTMIKSKDPRFWVHSALVREKPKINRSECALVWQEPYVEEQLGDNV